MNKKSLYISLVGLIASSFLMTLLFPYCTAINVYTINAGCFGLCLEEFIMYLSIAVLLFRLSFTIKNERLLKFFNLYSKIAWFVFIGSLPFILFAAVSSLIFLSV